MTRVNLVNPRQLADQHLVEEYRKIFMIGSALQRSLGSKAGVKDIPKNFTLNTGHIKFFFDKGEYISKRYECLIEEMKRRGMSPCTLFYTGFHQVILSNINSILTLMLTNTKCY